MAFLKRYAVFAVITACVLLAFYQLRLPSTPTPKESPKTNKHGGKIMEVPTYDWAKFVIQNPVTDMIPLPMGTPLPLPKIQFAFKEEGAIEKQLRETRLAEVKKAFERCWVAYEEKAWMQDELAPISGESKNPFGGWAATLIDSLDTLWIMGMKKEFKKAVQAAAKVNFGTSLVEKVNVFETNIRHLGGLLSAYELSGEKVLLQKAIEAGEMLYVAFDTPNRMPITRWDFHRAGNGYAQVADEVRLRTQTLRD
jgi:mannosyl-oligosaccharide alpha-1,2-mannosidase